MRQVTTFFYGLFMDEDLLRQQGLAPTRERVAAVADYDIRIGRRATMVPQDGSSVWGVAFDLTPAEIERLYEEPSVRDYRPEAVLATSTESGAFAALCYTIEAEPDAPANQDYAAKLVALAKRLGLPDKYRRRLERFRA
jgi:hypothetical protein